MAQIQTIHSSQQSPYQFSWGTFGFFVFLHAGAVLALFPFAFSWGAVALMLTLYWMTASLGICLGYHRYLTHRSLELPKWVAYTLVFIGTLACQNGPIKWVGQHRMHHANSDSDGDPHSARRGFWWSHFKWMLYYHDPIDNPQKLIEYTKDFSDDPFYQFLDKHFIAVQVAFGLILLAIGGLPFVVWGVFLRIVVTYHSTWFVNSAAHKFGYHNFKLEKDLSTNCWWVGLLAFGEGWHNNHHACPQSARHGLRPWEIDMTWMSICCLKFLGLAKNIKVATLEREEAKEGAPARYFTAQVTKLAA